MTKDEVIEVLGKLIDTYTDTDNMEHYEDIDEKNGITWASGNEFEYELKIKRTKHVADRRDL